MQTFQPVAGNARSVILASGTLSPLDTYESELRHTFVHKLSAKHGIPSDRIFAANIGKVTML